MDKETALKVAIESAKETGGRFAIVAVGQGLFDVLPFASSLYAVVWPDGGVDYLPQPQKPITA